MSAGRLVACLLVAAAAAALQPEALPRERAHGTGSVALAFQAPTVRAHPVEFEQQLFGRTNAEREAGGLPALAFDPDTIDLARWRAAQLVGVPAPQISHFDTDGRLVLQVMLANGGVSYRVAGENLAWIDADVPDAAFHAANRLMASPTHRSVILDRRFDRLAVGVAVREGERVFFVQILRTR